MLERARNIALQSRQGLEKGFAGSENPKLLRGQAHLDGRDSEAFRVQIKTETGEQVVTAAQVVLNTGTRALVPPIAGLNEIDFLDSGNWLHRPDLPGHLAIIGGGYIGLEMAQFYRRMGSEVTVIQRGHQITDREDPDVAQALQRVLAGEGIHFFIGAEVTQVKQTAAGVQLRLKQNGVEQTLDASHVFVAVGRKPNTDDLGLETVEVGLNEHGFVQIDERLATHCAGIWAAGDIRGNGQFTHTSWDDYRILKSQLIGDKQRTTKRIVPYAIFTDPELGRVGPDRNRSAAGGQEHQSQPFRYDRERQSDSDWRNRGVYQGHRGRG